MSVRDAGVLVAGATAADLTAPGEPERLVEASADALDGLDVVVCAIGVVAFDAAAARELRREGLRVVDVRPPHMATGLETRPIAGEPPRLPRGQDPAEWAARVTDAIEDEARTEVGSEA